MSGIAATPSRFIPSRRLLSGSGQVPKYLPDRRLRVLLWRALCLGATAVLVLPAARGDSAWFGWLPLWLVGMPACALWALHRFRLPRLPLPAPSARSLRRRRGGQARRRGTRQGQRPWVQVA